MITTINEYKKINDAYIKQPHFHFAYNFVDMGSFDFVNEYDNVKKWWYDENTKRIIISILEKYNCYGDWQNNYDFSSGGSLNPVHKFINLCFQFNYKEMKIPVEMENELENLVKDKKLYLTQTYSKHYFESKKINEAIEQYDFGFTTVIMANDVSYYNEELVIDKTKDQYIDANNLNIIWKMDFDNRKYGISSIAPIIKKISGYYTVITPSENNDEETEISFEPILTEWKITEVIGANFEFGHSIVPNMIEIDFKNKTIEITF